MGSNVCTTIQLPDGSEAAFCRTMDYGQATIILLLVALVFLEVFNTWRQRH